MGNSERQVENDWRLFFPGVWLPVNPWVCCDEISLVRVGEVGVTCGAQMRPSTPGQLDGSGIG